MTKWFDTNYHYMVPELGRQQRFALSSPKPVDEYLEAKALGYQTRPVLLGPVTYLGLAKSSDADFDTLGLLEGLLPVYVDMLRRLAAAGADWVQLDEPCLVLDLDDAKRRALQQAYGLFAREVPGLKIMLATYFGDIGDNLDTALSLPVAGLHLDLVRAPEQLDVVASEAHQHAVEDLPAEALVFLMGSRYCETDRLSEIAWSLFGKTQPGWARVQAICNYVHQHISFRYEHAPASRTAWEAYCDRTGVCRDYAHLAVAFCRCMNIPARYCTGYLGDIGVPVSEDTDRFRSLVRSLCRRQVVHL